MLIASLLIIFLLCSCNKSNSNFNDDIDDFIETDDISEEIDTPSVFVNRKLGQKTIQF
jgi:hypothetical protein